MLFHTFSVLESTEIVPNGLRSKLIFRPENKFILFSRGTKFCSERNKDLFRAEKIAINLFRGTNFFPSSQKNLWLAIGVVFRGTKFCSARNFYFYALFRAEQNFVPSEKTFFRTENSSRSFFRPENEKNSHLEHFPRSPALASCQALGHFGYYFEE